MTGQLFAAIMSDDREETIRLIKEGHLTKDEIRRILKGSK